MNHKKELLCSLGVGPGFQESRHDFGSMKTHVSSPMMLDVFMWVFWVVTHRLHSSSLLWFINRIL